MWLRPHGIMHRRSLHMHGGWVGIAGPALLPEMVGLRRSRVQRAGRLAGPHWKPRGLQRARLGAVQMLGMLWERAWTGSHRTAERQWLGWRMAEG